MKLRELHEQLKTPTAEDYMVYLKERGWYSEPKLKGKKGYVLKKYYPEKGEESFPTLADAKSAAPTHSNSNWQIYEVETGEPVVQPQWWMADQYYKWAALIGANAD